jgi:hypothetical protein
MFHVLDGKGGAKTLEGKEITPLLDENRSFNGAEICGAVTLQRLWANTAHRGRVAGVARGGAAPSRLCARI